jgi:hypothetical protein
MSNVISLNDIKFDLLKIIEPWDGILEVGNPKPVRALFNAYLNDLQKEKLIYDFSIDTADRDSAFTFDVNVRMSPTRSPKKLKIHVGVFQAPWVKKAA